MKAKLFTFFVFGFGAFSASAANISCSYNQEITQEDHESSDYVTNYEVEGTLDAQSGKLKITGTEYSLKKDGDKWVLGEKGNVYKEVDLRSNFKFRKKNGEYRVYTSSRRSDATGAFQYNFAFILKGEPTPGTTPTATYSKSTQTDDMPFNEHTPLQCKIQ